MLKIKLVAHKGYKENDLEKLKESLLLLEETVNGEPFKDTVLNFTTDKTEGGTFHFKKYRKKRKVTKLKRYTNQEIYDKIMEGNENDGMNGFIVLNLELEKGSGGKTVGYKATDGSIHTYTTDFREMKPGRMAAHIFHEYAHTLGFKHSKKEKHDALRNCYSVPYALGNFIEILTTGGCSRKCDYVPNSASDDSGSR